MDKVQNIKICKVINDNEVKSYCDLPGDTIINFVCGVCGANLHFQKKDVPVIVTCRECGGKTNITE